MQRRGRTHLPQVLHAASFGLVFALGCGGGKLPALDTAAAAKAAEALEQVPPGMEAKFAARGLFEVEAGRFDKSFLDGFDAFVNVAPDMRSRAVSEAIDANMGLLDAACAGGGRDVMKRASALAPDARIKMVWTDCAFAKHGLVTEAQALASEPTALMLGHMMYARLAASGTVDPNELKLLKAFSAAPSVLDEANEPPPNDGEGDPPLGDDPRAAPLE